MLLILMYIHVIFNPGKSPESKATTNALGKASEKPPQPTTRRGTRGGVRYLGEEEEPTEPTVEKRKAKTSPSASPTKQGSKSSMRKSPAKQGTTPPPGKRQTTPTSTRGKSSAQTGPTSTTPKKSTPQPAPPPAAAAASGTTPSLSRAQSYLRYKNRGGPRAPGSKQIPQGMYMYMYIVCPCAIVHIGIFLSEYRSSKSIHSVVQ